METKQDLMVLIICFHLSVQMKCPLSPIRLGVVGGE